MLAPVHRRREPGPARPELVGHLPPDLAGAVLVGLEGRLPKGGRGHGLLPLGHVGERVAHPVHDPNAVDAVRFTVAVPFAGAGRISAPRRRDAHFPWA